MPRACAFNARFLAHADSSLLPLLAPRLFAEAPYSQRTVRHGRISQKGQEIKSEKRRKSQTLDRVPVDCEQYGKGDAALCTNKTRAKQSTGLSSCQSQSRPSNKASGMAISKAALHLRYADISSFARQQLRCFSTESASPGDQSPARGLFANIYQREEVRGKEARYAFSQLVIRDIIYTVERIEIRLEETGARYTASVSSEELENRLSMLKNHPTTYFGDSPILEVHGDYRSLKRQYLNFTRNDFGTIDLRVRHGRLQDVSQRVSVFAFFDRLVYPECRQKLLGSLAHDPQCRAWDTMLFENAESADVEQISANWMRFGNSKAMIWPYLLIYLLHMSPDRALLFISVLIRDPGVVLEKVDVIADALTHISLVRRRKWDHDFPDVDRRYLPDVEKKSDLPLTFYYFLRDHCIGRFDSFPQSFYFNLAVLAKAEDLKLILDLLEERKVDLTANTLFHFVNAFAIAGEHHYAMHCLHLVCNSRPNGVLDTSWVTSSNRFRKSCALVLRRSITHGGQDYHNMNETIAAMVEMGLKMDRLLCNVVMKNAMDAGDYSTAFQIYNSLEDNGLEPDAITFSTLLSGCTAAAEPLKFQDFAAYCAQKALELRDTCLASDVLYYHYITAYVGVEGLEEHNFERIARIYSQFFSVKPLEPFFRLRSQQPAPDDEEVATDFGFIPLEPGPRALYILFQTRIQMDARISHERVWTLYSRLREAIKNNKDPHLTALGQQHVMWNAFILAFCKHQQFEYASQVIEDMRANNMQPDKYSWTIMMQRFFMAGQPQAALRIFENMEHCGWEPSKVTYSVLMIHYARTQQIDQVGEIMDHLDDEEMHPSVLTALGGIHDRQKLLAALKNSADRLEQMRIEEEKKVRMGNKLKEWRSHFLRPQGPTFASLLGSPGSTQPDSSDSDASLLSNESAKE